jgi:predicted nucleotidyltransferase
VQRSPENILGVLEEHREILGRYGVRRLALFGSGIRGDASTGSDLDFLVEFEKKSFDTYMELKFFLEELFDTTVDLVLTETLKPSLRDRILKETVDVPGL